MYQYLHGGPSNRRSVEGRRQVAQTVDRLCQVLRGQRANRRRPDYFREGCKGTVSNCRRFGRHLVRIRRNGTTPREL